MPAHRPAPGDTFNGHHGLQDRGLFFLLVHAGVALPAVAVGRHFVPGSDRILGQPWAALDCAPTGTEGHGRVVTLEQIGNAPPGGARAVLEMAVDARVPPRARVDHFVHGFVALIAVGHRELGALFEVEHERDRQPAPTGPPYRWRPASIALEISHRPVSLTAAYSALMLRSFTTLAQRTNSRSR